MPKQPERIYVHTLAELPDGESFVIIENDSVHIPGDERSREAPGHGYPASDKRFLSIIVFPKREDWEADIRTRTINHLKFKAVIIKTVAVDVNVGITIH